MAFDPNNPPLLAGDYSRFVATRATTLPATTGSVVAVPIVDHWGPEAVVTEVTSFQDYLKKFGTPVDPANPSPGYVAVYNAFKGRSSDKPGAGKVLVYRMVGADGLQATRNLASNAGTNAAALVVKARYKGTRGNNLRVQVIANSANPSTQRDLLVYDGTVQIQAFRGYTAAGVAQLQTDINASGGPIVSTGTPVVTHMLDVAASTALATGNSGTTLLAGNWTGFMDAIEPWRFGFVAPYDLTDDTIMASMVTWAKNRNAAQRSKRFFLVIGGALGEDYATADTRSASANDENVVNWGVGTYLDTVLNKQLSTSQLAPRLAGILASIGEGGSISFAQLEDLTIVEGPLDVDIAASIADGVVLCALGTNGVRFEKGVTTYTTTNNADKPFYEYSRIKYVYTMQDFERLNKEANESGDVIGALVVGEDTREFLVSDAQKRLDAKILAKAVRPGAKVVLSPEDGTDDDEFVALDWFGKFGRSLEQVRNTFYLS